MSTRSQTKSKPTVILNKTTGKPVEPTPPYPPFTVEEIGPIGVQKQAAWIKAIPFEEWPQQSKINDELRPSMVTNPEWHGFDKVAEELVKVAGYDASSAYNPMLSVVMPGHSIEPHQDQQPEYWKYRVHVPLLTNAKAVTEMGDGEHHMAVGKAYKVNTTQKHAVHNKGNSPRVHFMFDVR